MVVEALVGRNQGPDIYPFAGRERLVGVEGPGDIAKGHVEVGRGVKERGTDDMGRLLDLCQLFLSVYLAALYLFNFLECDLCALVIQPHHRSILMCQFPPTPSHVIAFRWPVTTACVLNRQVCYDP